MGRLDLQGTPWHYEQDEKGRYQFYAFHNRQNKRRKKQKEEEEALKPPMSIDVSMPGSYVFLRSVEEETTLRAMAHKNELNGLSVGEKISYKNKSWIVTDIQMKFHRI